MKERVDKAEGPVTNGSEYEKLLDRALRQLKSRGVKMPAANGRGSSGSSENSMAGTARVVVEMPSGVTT